MTSERTVLQLSGVIYGISEFDSLLLPCFHVNFLNLMFILEFTHDHIVIITVSYQKPKYNQLRIHLLYNTSQRVGRHETFEDTVKRGNLL